MSKRNTLDIELKALHEDPIFVKFFAGLMGKKIIRGIFDPQDQLEPDWRDHVKKLRAAGCQRSHCLNDYIATRLPEILPGIDMRQLLLLLFWHLQQRRPKEMGSLAAIADEAFWVEFLRVARFAKWRPKALWQEILDMPPAKTSPLMQVSAWLYFSTMRADYSERRLRTSAFAKLEHVQFSAEQKARWDKLVGFGFEALYRKQNHSSRLAIDMSVAALRDWFTYALDRGRWELAAQLLAEHDDKELGMDYQDIILYVVGNAHGEIAASMLRCLEERLPGFCAGFRDRRGHNLLWYSASCWQLRSDFAKPYTDCGHPRDKTPPGPAQEKWRELIKEHGRIGSNVADNRALLSLLFSYGLSPFEPNEAGFSLHDLDAYGREVGQRMAFTRLRANQPGFTDSAFWGLAEAKGARGKGKAARRK
jgi:hypothetical protein